MLVIAMMLRNDGSPIFFVQNRIGKGGRIFPCYKFCSMCEGAEELMPQYLAKNPRDAAYWAKYQKLPSDARMTPFGKRIRRFDMDELPQLFNVLKGDMSLVGPRPITPEQQKYYGDNLAYYDVMQPGITGPWQVSGRNALTFAQRVQLECDYVRHWSLWLDATILLKTIPAIIRNRDMC